MQLELRGAVCMDVRSGIGCASRLEARRCLFRKLLGLVGLRVDSDGSSKTKTFEFSHRQAT